MNQGVLVSFADLPTKDSIGNPGLSGKSGSISDIKSVPLLFACEDEKMGKPKYSDTTAVAAFVAGAALAAGITLLLSPKTGRQIRENIGDIKEEAVEKIKICAREAKFKLSPKTKPDAFMYEGGDCWI